MSKDAPTDSLITLPDGYRPWALPSRFNTLCGPYYEIVEDGAVVGLALQITDKHLNNHTIGHGGLLMSLADNAMGAAAARAYSGKAALVTASMNSEFMEPAKEGDWVEARADVQRSGKTLAFVSCTLTVQGRAIFQASGIFAVIQRRD